MARNRAAAAALRPARVHRSLWTRVQGACGAYCSREFAYAVLTDPRYVGAVGWALLAVELALNLAIVRAVPYTEIDWRTYMQQCEGFLNGTWDYARLRGDTGPLVYPAGFVYVYSALYYVTSRGADVALAQHVFVALHLAQLALTFRVYARTRKVPPYALVLATLTSYRVHSIYVLRLFNDPVSVALVYGGLNLVLAGRWAWGSALYSLAVSVKMSALLYAPALLLAWLTSLGWRGACRQLALCAAVQLALAAPFLHANCWGYVRAAFDLGRVFDHTWTVNYRFLERAVFESRWLHAALLALHVALLALFYPAARRYLASYAVLRQAEAQFNQKKAALRGRARRPHHQHQRQQEPPLTADQRRFLDSYESALKRRHGGAAAADPPARPAPAGPDHDELNVNFDSSSQLLVLPLFVCNLVGVACARSLHYQFYVWYFHSLAYLAHCTPYSRPAALLLLALIEYCWNVYPSTAASSALLHACHAALLLGVLRAMRG